MQKADNLQITELNIKDLRPFTENPRKNDATVDYLVQSIAAFGFSNPVIIDRDRNILCGHSRIKAAEKIGMIRVPCIYVDDLTEEQAEAFRLAENRTAELAGWDYAQLEEELAEVHSRKIKLTQKASELQLGLTVLFVAALMISNVITSKQVLLPFNITTSGGLFVFPITYILSDLFSEVYGYRWSRITCYLAFAMNLLMVLIFAAVIHCPSPSYWTDQEAFKTVLGSTPRVLAASLAAFVLGDLVNDRVFRRMKLSHVGTHKGFGLRASLSSVAGELVDSLIFFPIAFIGQMPFKTLVIMIITEVIVKTGYEVIILPVTTFAVKKVSEAEAK